MNCEYSYEDMIEKIGKDRLHEKYTEVLASANHFIEADAVISWAEKRKYTCRVFFLIAGFYL